MGIKIHSGWCQFFLWCMTSWIQFYDFLRVALCRYHEVFFEVAKDYSWN